MFHLDFVNFAIFNVADKLSDSWCYRTNDCNAKRGNKWKLKLNWWPAFG